MLKEMNMWLKEVRCRKKSKEWWKTLCAKMRGHYEYCRVSGNSSNIILFEDIPTTEAGNQT